MSQEELDSSSLTARVLQLEENQVVLKRYIAKLKRQLESHEQLFNDRSEPRQLESLMEQVATIQQRLNLEIGEKSIISEPPIELDTQTENKDFQAQLIFDRPKSRAVLIEALSVAQERLIIVCPWLNCNSINDELLPKFRDCLNRGCLIDIGWGYLGDRQNIGKGWRYNALADLQELEGEYPNQFSLVLLGTHENFLVCDSSFALLGSHNLLTNSDQSAEKEVGICTNDCQILKQLIERFDSSEVLDEEEIERRFVASSDYLDRGDYLEGLAADAEDIALEDSCEDVEDESEECLEPVVSVEEFLRRYSEGEKDFTGINLAGADLSGKSIKSGVNLSNANLVKANLSQADLRSANLNQSNLSNTNLSNADLRSANLNQANLANANLNQANLSSANLNQANLANANFSQADLCSAKLEKANLRKASLRAAKLEYANFSEADLNGANLSGSTLSQQTKFTSANLGQANLSGLFLRKVDMINADLTNANLSNTNLLEANLDGANIKGVQLQGAIYDEATLFPTEFDPVTTGAYLLAPDVSLPNVDLTGRYLISVKLMGADLQGVNLSSTQLNYSDLRGANLSVAKLQGANLDNTNLGGANLRLVNLRNARLSEADLTTADLTEADL
ncbi:MAG: pentapeptide repeat-containing protein, partial [Microcoleus sp.]